MQKRNLVAAAGGLGAIAVAAAVAVSANVGLFGLTRDEGGPGHLQLVTRSPATTTVSQPGITTSTTSVKHDADNRAGRRRDD